MRCYLGLGLGNINRHRSPLLIHFITKFVRVQIQLPPPHLLTLPTQGSSTWLAGWGVDSWMVWVLIECESPVTSPHHAPYAAWLALGVFPPSLFFLCVFFFVLFFGGLGGHESWPGLWPPI